LFRNVAKFLSKLKAEREQLAVSRNVNSGQLKELGPAAEDTQRKNLLAEGTRLRNRWEQVKTELWRLEQTALLTALRLPNVTRISAPPTDKVVHKHCRSEAPPRHLANLTPRSHVQLIIDNDLGEFSSNRYRSPGILVGKAESKVRIDILTALTIL
jgi:seryl-tRNA synthetase